MDIVAQRVAFSTHHEGDLGVGLDVHEPVDDLHPGAFEVARPPDVALLIEAGLELNHRRDRLAGLCRLDQGGDDGRVLGGPVQGLLDRDHRRVVRRLAQELHHDVERLVRVVNDDVLGLNGGEAIAAEVTDPLGKARDIGLELEVGTVIGDQLIDIDQTEKSLQAIDVLLRHPQLLGHEGA